METISQENRMISEKEFQHVAEDAQIVGLETREEIKNRYMGSDSRPWIVAYSGGKDSTLLTQLVFEAIKEVPPSKRKRKVYVLSSNTLVETPHVIDLVRKSMAQMNTAATSLKLPIETHLS
jgi:DNA sulfur modification protein DndC